MLEGALQPLQVELPGADLVLRAGSVLLVFARSLAVIALLVVFLGISGSASGSTPDPRLLVLQPSQLPSGLKLHPLPGRLLANLRFDFSGYLRSGTGPGNISAAQWVSSGGVRAYTTNYYSSVSGNILVLESFAAVYKTAAGAASGFTQLNQGCISRPTPTGESTGNTSLLCSHGIVEVFTWRQGTLLACLVAYAKPSFSLRSLFSLVRSQDVRIDAAAAAVAHG
jgi:hypothetical protein